MLRLFFFLIIHISSSDADHTFVRVNGDRILSPISIYLVWSSFGRGPSHTLTQQLKFLQGNFVDVIFFLLEDVVHIPRFCRDRRKALSKGAMLTFVALTCCNVLDRWIHITPYITLHGDQLHTL